MKFLPTIVRSHEHAVGIRGTVDHGSVIGRALRNGYHSWLGTNIIREMIVALMLPFLFDLIIVVGIVRHFKRENLER